MTRWLLVLPVLAGCALVGGPSRVTLEGATYAELLANEGTHGMKPYWLDAQTLELRWFWTDRDGNEHLVKYAVLDVPLMGDGVDLMGRTVTEIYGDAERIKRSRVRRMVYKSYGYTT